MRIPDAMLPLVEVGAIDEVIRPLMSGKEAQVYLVRTGGEIRVAKVYKDAENRSFRQRAIYAEGRQVRNSRRQRAINKRSKYGKEEEEAAWRSAEVDAIFRLSEAGVAVPQPFDFVEGVFVMSLVADEHGEPAPRLVDLELTKREAEQLFQDLVREVVKMLCAGLVHGDLSDFNVLLGADGPVIIDFPQAVDAASNNNARKLLLRDVKNLQSFLARFAPGLKKMRYGEEMWELYAKGDLHPHTKLTGRFKRKAGKTDTDAIVAEIIAAELEEQRRRVALGLDPLPRRRSVPTQSVREPQPIGADGGGRSKRARNRKKPRGDRRPEGAGASRPKGGGGNRPNPRGPAPRKARAPTPKKPPKDDLFDLDALLIVED